MNRRTATIALVVFGAGLGIGAVLDNMPARTVTESVVLPGTSREDADVRIAKERTSALVLATRTASPSVVAITVTTREVVRTTSGDPFFDMFFGAPDPQVRQASSWGSGVIVDARGYVLTNNHVVESAIASSLPSDIRVNLPDGRGFAAKVVGSDKDNDLAVLRIDGKDLPVAKIAPAVPEIGDWVLAIGNPYGNLIDDPRPSVTVGVMSAVDRSFTPHSGVGLRHVLQTDAAINPGNSGGALVNSIGEVVGINTFIFTGGGQSQGSIGLGFAIPVQRAMRIVEEIIRYGRVRDFTTGLATDRYAAQAMGLRRGDGVLVSEVQAGSPGAKAGLRPGDVITGLDGRKVSDLEELRSVLRLFRVGDNVPLRVRRDGKEFDATMELAEDAGRR